MSEEPPVSPNLAILVSIIAVSTASILIRISDAPPLAIATYRMFFSTLILAPFFLSEGGFNVISGMGRRDVLTLLGVGITLALHFASWITSLSYTSVASSVIFVHVDPFFVALISHYWLGERISLKTALGIVLGFAGSALIAWGDAGLGELNLYGDLLALIGAIMLGIYILSGRQIRQRLGLVEYVTPVYATSAIVLLLITIASRTRITGYPPGEFIIFLLIAIVPMIFGHTVYNWALRYVSAPIVSISLLGEPVGASILAYMILGEAPTPITLLGGTVTLAGILLTVYKRSKRD
ncbi:MAG: DMT family transporter [Candidatus Bathyarchaeia archaeon]